MGFTCLIKIGKVYFNLQKDCTNSRSS